MLKSYKYRIYPNNRQKELIEKTFGVCRLVYNIGLAVKIESYKNAGVNVSAFQLINQLSEMKRDYEWMKEVDSQALQASVRNIETSFKNFFNGKGYPKFKSKNGHQSFKSPNLPLRIAFEANLLTIPKIKNIPIVLDRLFTGNIKSVTISKNPTGKYYASILVQDGKELPNKVTVSPETTVGIDLGIKDFLITSTGLKIANPKYLKNSLKRLKCLQRRASRKKKGSNNRKKANKRLALIHERVSNQRKDFLHKVTTKLIIDNQATTFCIENLNVAGMVKNHKLAQAISDAGWSEFARQMRYKVEWTGKNVIEIGRFEPSSKTCSHCGTINQTLTLADREWACASCLTVHDRDLNAAINIKNIGLKKHSGVGSPGEPVELRRLRRAKKQELSN